MHKLLIDVKRNSGSTIKAGKCFISTEPDTKTAAASSIKFPIYFRAYELECLTEDEIRSASESDFLKILIEKKGYTFTNILKPNGEMLRGEMHLIKSNFLNKSTADSLQLLSTHYLEQIFGYWNVYEMDIQKFTKTENIMSDGFINIYGYENYKIDKIKIIETNGSPASGTNSIIQLTDENDTVFLEQEISKNIDIDIDVNKIFTADTGIKIKNNNWDLSKLTILCKQTKIQ